MSYNPFPRTSNPEEDYSLQEEQPGYYQTSTLRNPQFDHQRSGYPAPVDRLPSPYVSPYAPVPQSQAYSSTAPGPSGTSGTSGTSTAYPSAGFLSTLSAPPSRTMSAYSSSSQENTVYSNPGPRQYRFDTSATMSNSLSQSERNTLIQTLRTHRVNTLIELRRIEKALARNASPEVTEPMTSAWAHYVNSNSLISELRGLTRNYPFSSECVDEAKWMVIGDPESTRSWNYCWLVLMKIRNENLIQRHARKSAVNPSMWGGRAPTATGIEQLSAEFTTEWTNAVDQMLRHWDVPPTTTGN